MALNKELWTKVVQDVFYSDDSFMGTIPNYTDFVDNKNIHVPNYGTNALSYIKNNTVWPLTGSTTITNEEKLVSMDHLTFPKVVLSNPVEDYELSYDKKAEVLKQSLAYLKNVSSNNIILDLAASSGVTVILSTGSGVTAVDEVNQTGNRKAITAKDVRKAKLKFDKQNIPADKRYWLIPSDFQEYIMDLKGFISAEKMVDQKEIITPDVIGKMYGFTVIVRDNVLLTNSSNTLITSTNDIAAVAEVTTNQASLFYSAYTVGKALGEVKTFVDLQNTDYQSDLISYHVRQKAFSTYKVAIGLLVLTECVA